MCWHVIKRITSHKSIELDDSAVEVIVVELYMHIFANKLPTVLGSFRG